MLAAEGQPLADRAGPTKLLSFPGEMRTVPGGLRGDVNRDGCNAVPPRHDWIGPFADNRAAVRLAHLYGFVDETGREVVKPQNTLVFSRPF